ncbi:MAG: TIGR03943 family protein [Bacillus sp. (in: Bacteria)]|nr:TIGR03943 family protein [Bacillus sp. (in: firmicutes)]
MYFHSQQAVKAIILLLFSGYIFMLHHTGEISRFINPQYTAFSQVASIIFLFLFFIQVPRICISKEQAEDHDYCTILGCSHDKEKIRQLPFKSIVIYAIIVLPLVTGFILPSKELGVAEAVKRGVCYAPNQTHYHSEDIINSNEALTEMLESPVIVLEHSNFAKYVNHILTYPELFYDKPIELDGFILDELNLNDHVLLGRFLVTHCVADAHVTGLLLSTDDDHLRKVNGWVKVWGIIAVEKK